MNEIRKNISSRLWQRLDDRLLEKTRVFDLRVQRMRSPKGDYEDDFYYIQSPDWVNVIPITTEGEVIFVEQFRQGVRSQSLETPGGIVDHPSDDPLETARRELEEETGYSAPKLVLLGSIHPNPAMLTNRCHIFLAENCSASATQNLEPSEDILVKKMPLREVPLRIQRGEVTHALVVSAFFLLSAARPDLLK